VSVRPLHCGHVGLAARELERTVEFYERTLGMRISDRMAFPEDSPFYEGVWMRINTDHHALSVFGLRDTGARDDAADGGARPGVHHFGFEVASFEDLLRILRYARSHDVPIYSTRSGGPGNQLRVYLRDPDDNIVELYFAMDQVGWDGLTRPFPPVTETDLETFDIASWLEWKGPEVR
jgi:catechol 2,3-dioxygenase